MDQITQIQIYINSIVQMMIDDLRWMGSLKLTVGESSALNQLADTGTTGTVGENVIVQPLNIHQLDRFSEYVLVSVHAHI